MEIAIDQYVAALKTWCKVARRDEEESAEINRACAALQWRFGKNAKHEPDVFCEYMRKRGRYSIDLIKSCLLDRLIYAQEPLRTRPCPQHKGRWSGCSATPCPHGCNFGSNITGWLPETVSASVVESRAPVFVEVTRHPVCECGHPMGTHVNGWSCDKCACESWTHKKFVAGFNSDDGIQPGAPIYRRVPVPEGCETCDGCPDCLTNNNLPDQ